MRYEAPSLKIDQVVFSLLDPGSHRVNSGYVELEIIDSGKKETTLLQFTWAQFKVFAAWLDSSNKAYIGEDKK